MQRGVFGHAAGHYTNQGMGVTGKGQPRVTNLGILLNSSVWEKRSSTKSVAVCCSTALRALLLLKPLRPKMRCSCTAEVVCDACNRAENIHTSSCAVITSICRRKSFFLLTRLLSFTTFSDLLNATQARGQSVRSTNNKCLAAAAHTNKCLTLRRH